MLYNSSHTIDLVQPLLPVMLGGYSLEKVRILREKSIILGRCSNPGCGAYWEGVLVSNAITARKSDSYDITKKAEEEADGQVVSKTYNFLTTRPSASSWA